MLPVSDVIPSRTTPAVTISLIVALAAIFLYEVQLDDRSVRALADRYGVTPAEFWWPTAFTSLFLHSGWLQAATNALYLWLFGGTVESAFGRGRFLVCYLFCGAAGASVHAMIHAPS